MNDESSIPDSEQTVQSNSPVQRKQLLNIEDEPAVEFETAVKDLIQFTNVSHMLNSQPQAVQDINDCVSQP